jgi:hypothetical protein
MFHCSIQTKLQHKYEDAQQRQVGLPVHSFLPQPLEIDSLKCSDRLDHEMLDSIDELAPCQEENSTQAFFLISLS